ncbi:lipoprotein insertase outer membrane protein LolB [Oceanicoccus sagamiensis]|uniref:lipoprotein insertase outer membrane protein LolB n=1 Tax=Oceanicoccus sagamiensis TaxID=716816 RepID=UPI00146B0EE5|nr:lipoprotein insertase outer membrane protein LolB [Oceanicoccus sagamiensis]
MLLSACSNWQQTPAQPANSMTGLANNGDIKHWAVRGKVGLRTTNEAHSAYLNWSQCGDAFDIRISGPLGQGAAHLVGNTEQVYLTTSDNQHFSASSANALLAQQLGWTLPVEQLRYWIKALPDPSQDYQANPPQQTLGFQQQSWQLSYPRLTQQGDYQLPSKIIAEQTPLKVTLVIKQWQLKPACNHEASPP